MKNYVLLFALAVALTGVQAADLRGGVVPLARLGEKGQEKAATAQTVHVAAWRNERVNTAYCLWNGAKEALKGVRVSVGDFVSAHGARMPASAAQVQRVRDLASAGDAFADGSSVDLAETECATLWVTLAVPKATEPDVYRGMVTLTPGTGKPLVFTLEVDVGYDVLPDVSAWKVAPELLAMLGKSETKTWGTSSPAETAFLGVFAQARGVAALQQRVQGYPQVTSAMRAAILRDAVENCEKIRLLEESHRATWRLGATLKWKDGELAAANAAAYAKFVEAVESAIEWMVCPGYMHNRKIVCEERQWGAEVGYLEPVTEMHLVQHPKPNFDKPGRPLYVVLHSSGHNAVNALRCTASPDNHDIYLAPDDFFALYLDCKTAPDDWWYGINKKPGFEISACERRMLKTIEEVVVKYGIDRERIYLCGNSMGGSGCLGFGIRNGDIFAAVKGNVPALVQHACDRMGWDMKADADVPGVDWASLPDPPLIIDHTAPNDMRWSEGREHMFRMMTARRYPYIAYWADHKHCNKNSIITAANDLYLTFDWTSLRKSDLLPAFTDASSNTPCPWPDHRDAKGAGQWNAFFRWGKGNDTPEKLSLDLYLADLTSHHFVVPARVTADVTLRRVKTFKVQPGDVVMWTFGDRSGKVTVGADARITIPRLEITRTAQTLVVRH
ncbi:MAG: DUF6067 family protein [Kiritimatiellae bacterium]|nr:DUF6067 family protein [Kiritimatiellia bacterium]